MISLSIYKHLFKLNWPTKWSFQTLFFHENDSISCTIIHLLSYMNLSFILEQFLNTEKSLLLNVITLKTNIIFCLLVYSWKFLSYGNIFITKSQLIGCQTLGSLLLCYNKIYCKWNKKTEQLHDKVDLIEIINTRS